MRVPTGSGAFAEGQVIDPGRLHSLAFLIANNPVDPYVDHRHCVTESTWLDPEGQPIAGP